MNPWGSGAFVFVVAAAKYGAMLLVVSVVEVLFVLVLEAEHPATPNAARIKRADTAKYILCFMVMILLKCLSYDGFKKSQNQHVLQVPG
jgi:hypothetical protein